MTEADHVRAIGLFNERNPLPHVLTVKLGPLVRRGADRHRASGCPTPSAWSRWRR